MLRPAPARSLLGYVPLRLAASVFLLFALLLAAAVVVGIQFERYSLLSSGAIPSPEGLPGGLTWKDALKIVAILLTLAAAAILLFTTFQNYRSTTQTFERVKTLMRNVLESIPTGVLTLDSDGALTSLNSAAERLLGVRASMVVGRPLEDALQHTTELAAWVRAALSGRGLFQESDLSVSGAESRRLTLRVSAAELRNESNRFDGLVVLLRDVTEVSRLELQLRRADKLAALGTLAAGVAHEVKNPLHALGLNLHLLVQELGAPQPSKVELEDYLGILRAEIERIHQIVENFLRFSKPSIPEVKPLDLNALVERVLSLVGFEAAGHRVGIQTEFDPELDTIAGDEGQLAQVVLNLVINAMQAMPTGGNLTLTTRRDNGWGELTVRDTGEGIPHDVVPQIFDPYFTTRQGGSGLGLAIAHRIVEGHNGTIDVESKAGLGTTMVVRLPLAGRPMQAARSA
ncbi:MAG TPA: ATP-binding protein [Methylomirabilota bacterium]|nr:ATP-binding protein [Methylomirabilota bacterium]